MKRPDLATLACVNPECQRFRLTGQANLTVRKVYGQDHIRLLRCRTCGEEFSERRGTALFVLDHRVGHLVSITTSDKHRLDSVKGCTRRAPSSSLARSFSHDSGLRRRELWN